MPSTSTPYFERVAAQWDTLRASFFPDSLRDRVVAATRCVQTDDRPAVVLDVGAGTGFLTEGFLAAGGHPGDGRRLRNRNLHLPRVRTQTVRSSHRQGPGHLYLLTLDRSSERR